MHRLTILLTLCALAVCASCTIGGSSVVDDDAQILKLQESNAPGSAAVLNLEGPEGNGSAPVSYFVFGSDSNLGDHSDVPLSNFRRDELLVATLDTGESETNVDLTPWTQYEYVYLRAIPPQPQIIVELKDGVSYTFSTN